MNIVAIVPMKLNNRRLPNKNIKPFTGGKPLCHYVLSTLLTVQDVNDVYVYCSDPIIQEYLPENVHFLKRPNSLDQDITKINEVLSCFAETVFADIYVLSHVTSPFISKDAIEKGLHAVINSGYDSAFAARKVQAFLWKDGLPFNYSPDNIPRTQDIDPVYEETSGFYIFKRNVISQFNRRIGFNPFIVEVGAIEGIDIDESEDFEIANAIFSASRGGIAH